MATDLKEPSLELPLVWQENGILTHSANLSDDFYDDDDDCLDNGDTDSNPFALGYSLVRRGRKTIEIPLTEEDWIHPKFGDFRVNTQTNQLAAKYCWQGFARELTEMGQGVVLFDQLLRWGRLNLNPPIRNLGPDLAVISNMDPAGFDKDKAEYAVTPETIPNLVVEILSKTTAKHDRGRKKQLYQQIGVEQYVLIDVRPKVYKPRFPRLQSFTLQEIEPGHLEYVQQSLNAQGRVFLPSVRLYIGLEEGTEVYLYRVDGERVPGYEELVADNAQLAADKARLATNNAKLEEAMAQALALLGAGVTGSQDDRLSLLGAILKNATALQPNGGENGAAQA